MVFQLANCGGRSLSVIRSMKAAGSIGANSPLRFRLLVMTCATPAPTSPSAGVPATKFGIAIGVGADSLVTRGDAWPNARWVLRIRPLDAIPERN